MQRRKVIMSGALLIGGLIVCIPTNDTVLKHNKDWKLINHISQKYDIDYFEAKKIVDKVNESANYQFPSRIDVLSIIAIESRFKHKAVSKKGAKGWMQILYKKVHTEDENLLAGIELLVDYRQKLGSEEAAIHAYNVGIKNYKDGKRNINYYDKYLNTKKELIQYEC